MVALAKERIHRKPVLRSLESTDFLQADLVAGHRRPPQDWIDRTGGSRPRASAATSCGSASMTTSAGPSPSPRPWSGVTSFSTQERFFRAADLPYRTQFVPLAAHSGPAWDRTETGNRAMMRRWYWCGVLGEMYGGRTETRFARDLEQVPAWVNGGRGSRGRVGEAAFYGGSSAHAQDAQLRRVQGRVRAADAARVPGLDQGPADGPVVRSLDYKIDIHHIFPKAGARRTGSTADHRRASSTRRRSPSITNRTIGGVAPSKYLDKVEKKSGLGRVLRWTEFWGPQHLGGPGHLCCARTTSMASSRPDGERSWTS